MLRQLDESPDESIVEWSITKNSIEEKRLYGQTVKTNLKTAFKLKLGSELTGEYFKEVQAKLPFGEIGRLLESNRILLDKYNDYFDHVFYVSCIQDIIYLDENAKNYSVQLNMIKTSLEDKILEEKKTKSESGKKIENLEYLSSIVSQLLKGKTILSFIQAHLNQLKKIIIDPILHLETCFEMIKMNLQICKDSFETLQTMDNINDVRMHDRGAYEAADKITSKYLKLYEVILYDEYICDHIHDVKKINLMKKIHKICSTIEKTKEIHKVNNLILKLNQHESYPLFGNMSIIGPTLTNLDETFNEASKIIYDPIIEIGHEIKNVFFEFRLDQSNIGGIEKTNNFKDKKNNLVLKLKYYQEKLRELDEHTHANTIKELELIIKVLQSSAADNMKYYNIINQLSDHCLEIKNQITHHKLFYGKNNKNFDKKFDPVKKEFIGHHAEMYKTQALSHFSTLANKKGKEGGIFFIKITIHKIRNKVLQNKPLSSNDIKTMKYLSIIRDFCEQIKKVTETLKLENANCTARKKLFDLCCTIDKNEKLSIHSIVYPPPPPIAKVSFDDQSTKNYVRNRSNSHNPTYIEETAKAVSQQLGEKKVKRSPTKINLGNEAPLSTIIKSQNIRLKRRKKSRSLEKSKKLRHTQSHDQFLVPPIEPIEMPRPTLKQTALNLLPLPLSFEIEPAVEASTTLKQTALALSSSPREHTQHSPLEPEPLPPRRLSSSEQSSLTCSNESSQPFPSALPQTLPTAISSLGRGLWHRAVILSPVQSLESNRPSQENDDQPRSSHVL